MATIWDEFMAQRDSPDYTLGSRATLQPTRSPFSPDGRVMAQRGSPDYTLGSRATLQPTGSPFSPDGRLGNMGMRNMLLAQQRMSTMPGFMPPDYSVPVSYTHLTLPTILLV